MAEETPKIEQPKTTPVGGAAADVVASAKVFAAAAQTAVIKQGEMVRDKVVGTADNTKTTVVDKGVEVKDKVVGTADNTKTAVVDKGVEVKDKVVGTADNTKTGATDQGGNIKDKVVGAVGGMLEATKTGVVQCVDKAQNYLNPPTSTTTTDPASPTPAADKKE